MLSIAGSDSGGGAGIQADLKAFARCGVHGMTAITALTAQNTVGVEAVAAVPPEMIVAQVARGRRRHRRRRGQDRDARRRRRRSRRWSRRSTLVGDAPVVVDPVMVAESGAVLLDPDARAALIERVLPLATVATPNLPEARALRGLGERADAERARRGAVLALGPGAVVVTGGHSDDGADVFFDGGRLGADPGPALSRRRRARLRLHALLGARRVPGPRARARSRRRAGRAEIAAEAVGARAARDRRGPGPVDVFGIGPGAAGIIQS